VLKKKNRKNIPSVVGLDLDPFLLSGGGAFCMTLRLDLASASARAAALAS